MKKTKKERDSKTVYCKPPLRIRLFALTIEGSGFAINVFFFIIILGICYMIGSLPEEDRSKTYIDIAKNLGSSNTLWKILTCIFATLFICSITFILFIKSTFDKMLKTKEDCIAILKKQCEGKK